MTWMSLRWIHPASTADAWAVGAMWLAMTLAFEFVAGHYVFHTPWTTLLADYNIFTGRLWILVLDRHASQPPCARLPRWAGFRPVGWSFPHRRLTIRRGVRKHAGHPRLAGGLQLAPPDRGRPHMRPRNTSSISRPRVAFGPAKARHYVIVATVRLKPVLRHNGLVDRNG